MSAHAIGENRVVAPRLGTRSVARGETDASFAFGRCVLATLLLVQDARPVEDQNDLGQYSAPTHRSTAQPSVLGLSVLTQIQHMDVSKAGMAVASAKHNHLVADEVGRVVSLFLWDIAAGPPFVPSEAVWI